MDWQQVLEKYREEETGHYLDEPLSSIHQRDLVLDTPIITASIRRVESELRALLEGGANPNDAGEKNYTPLHYAVTYNSIALVKLLLSYGANIHAINDFDMSPLDIAKDEGLIEIYRLLQREDRQDQAVK